MDSISKSDTCCFNCFFALALVLCFLPGGDAVIGAAVAPPPPEHRGNGDPLLPQLKFWTNSPSCAFLYISRRYGSAVFPVLESRPTDTIV